MHCYTVTSTYDVNNRLTNQSIEDIRSAGKNINYYYDANGNRTYKQTQTYSESGAEDITGGDADTGTVEVYTYNLQNQLTGYQSSTSTASYEYGANGLRKSKTVNGETTGFVWNGANLAAELNENGIKNLYGYGADGISTIKSGSTTRLYLKNAHGDVVGKSDTSGNMQSDYRYDAFGNVLSGTTPDPFGYCGEYLDDETGNIYLRARYYDTANGMFINEDPAKDRLNWYGYCMGNPILFSDPLGTEYIAVSGAEHNVPLVEHRYKYNFIEPAIKKIGDLKELNDGETITWLICSMGYAKSDKENFSNTAKEYGVELRFFSTNDSLVRYINTKGYVGSTEKRDADKIKKFVLFSLGLVGSIEFGYHQYNQIDVSFDSSQIMRLREEAFDNPNSCFYSCNTGTDINGISFAQSWVNKTGGKTWAIYEKSDYEYINNLDNWENVIKPERRGTGYRPGGSDYYPIPSTERNAFWKTFARNVVIF